MPCQIYGMEISIFPDKPWDGFDSINVSALVQDSGFRFFHVVQWTSKYRIL